MDALVHTFSGISSKAEGISAVSECNGAEANVEMAEASGARFGDHFS